MANQRDDKLRRLLQRAELNKPGASFTDEVMKEIESEVVTSPLLKSLLKNVPIENPKEDFTHIVMDQLEVSDFKTSEVSIISGKVWLAISVILVLLILVAFTGRPENNPSTFSYFHEIGKSLHPIITFLNSIPSISIICLSSVSGLLLLDYFLKEKILGSEK